MDIKNLIASAAVATVVGAGAATAGTVSPGSDVVFEFDLSAIGAIRFTSSGYSCSAGFPECDGQDGLFDDRATFRVLYGTSIGASDIATREFVNRFGRDIGNAAGAFVTAPSFDVAASVDTLYATITYVDDIFGVTSFQLNFTEGVEDSGLAPVPLPASLPLLLIAFGGLALVRRRQV